MLIKRILIITADGIPLFDFEDYTRGDEVLVSGLLAGFLRFAEETEKEKISRVILEESQFILSLAEDLVFIFQISDNMPYEYAEFIITKISNKFLSLFREQLKAFRGQVSVFRSFQCICRKILDQCGIYIANELFDEKSKMSTAFGIYSDSFETLVVQAHEQNYNFDSFAIFHLFCKSLRKIITALWNSKLGIAYHLSLEGSLILTINLPYIFIVIATKIKDFNVSTIKEFKTKSNQQLKDTFFEKFNPTDIEVYSRRSLESLKKDKGKHKHKILCDSFKAGEKGFSYLYDTKLLSQFIMTTNNASIIFKLPNRTLFLDFEEHKSAADSFEELSKIFSLDS